MKVEQIRPSVKALEGVGLGDVLAHFKVAHDGKECYVAVLVRGDDASKRPRTACTCRDAFEGFADADRKPCCKHAEEGMRYMREEL